MKALAITAIVSVAVIMGMSAVAPAMAIPGGAEGDCPKAFEKVTISDITDTAVRQQAEAVEAANGISDDTVCLKQPPNPRAPLRIIDNIIPSRSV